PQRQLLTRRDLDGRTSAAKDCERRGSSQAAHRAKTVAVDGDGDAIAQLDLVALNRKGLALQRRRRLENTEKDDRNALAALVRPSSSRRVSSCSWVALCERRRAGFARLSGWQPIGNWVASAGEFSSIPVTRRRYPDKRAEESRRAVCAEKWPEAQADRVAGVHVFSSTGRGRNHPPRRGSFFCRQR